MKRTAAVMLENLSEPSSSNPGRVIQPETASRALKRLKTAGKVATVAAVAKSAYDFGSSVHKDSKRDTSRNTTTTATGIGAGLAGGKVGSVIGTAVGAPLGPVGAFIGGFIGGAVAGVLFEKVGTAAMDVISDELGYDMKDRKCDKCGEQFKARAHLEQKTCKKCKK